jgi:dTDP-4-dehydrorhamnose 3,5-epimerase
MRFTSTSIPGVIIVDPEPIHDERGFFVRLSCPIDMARAGFSFRSQQTSLSRNIRRHTLRGMHSCAEAENKLVHCTAGAIYDVALDLRKDSPAYLSFVGIELDAVSGRTLFIPAGVSHGFLTLQDNCDVLYQIDRIYRPGYDIGVRWNDPTFGVLWPAAPEVISSRDASYPDYIPLKTC